MTKIRIRCRTNLDRWKRTVWPTEAACRPMVGDSVEGVGGAMAQYGYKLDDTLRPKLKVCQVTHTVDVNGPILELELHN